MSGGNTLEKVADPAGLFEKPKESTPSRLDTLRPEFQGLSSSLGSYGQTLVGKEATPYGGSFTAGMSNGENDILGHINSMITSNGSFSPQRDSLISSILSGSRLSPNSNPYLDSTINEVMRKSNEGLGINMNMLDAAFGSRGMLGPSSGRSEQALQLSRNSNRDMQSTIASILSGNYQNGLNEQMNVLSNVLPNMDNNKSAMLNSALSANSLPRILNQNDLNAMYQEFIRQQQGQASNTAMASNILSSSPQYSYTPKQYQPMSPLAQLIMGMGGGAAQGATTALLA